MVEITFGQGGDAAASGRLRVLGAAYLGGTLRLKPAAAFHPEVGDEVVVMFFASPPDGDFATLEGPPPGEGLTWESVLSDTRLTLRVEAVGDLYSIAGRTGGPGEGRARPSGHESQIRRGGVEDRRACRACPGSLILARQAR